MSSYTEAALEYKRKSVTLRSDRFSQDLRAISRDFLQWRKTATASIAAIAPHRIIAAGRAL
jgi:hypothetical protein